MPARESIYLSFGTFANHITTSFFNEQAAYLGTKEDDVVDSTVALAEGPSFSAGLDAESQLYPRAILFDVQDQIGSLSQRTGVMDDEELLYNQQFQQDNVLDRHNASAAADAELLDSAPDLNTFLQSNGEQEQAKFVRQPRKPQEEYDLEGGSDEDPKISSLPGPLRTQRRRELDLLWSDYQQFYIHPKSVVGVKGGPLRGPCSPMPGSTARRVHRSRRSQKAPDEPTTSESDEEEDGHSGAVVMSGFEAGYAVAKEMDAEGDVFEDRVRWLAEDSNSLQVRAFRVGSQSSETDLMFSYFFVFQIQKSVLQRNQYYN